MTPRQVLGTIIALVGIALIVLGLRAGDSIASQISNFFTGNPTDRAIWLTIGGVAATLFGVGMALLPLRTLRS